MIQLRYAKQYNFGADTFFFILNLKFKIFDFIWNCLRYEMDLEFDREKCEFYQP